MKKAIWTLIAIVGLGIWIVALAWVFGDKNTSAQFVQDNCQYSERPLRDGECDNEDPCDPETLKDPVLHGDCRDRDQVEIETIEPKETTLTYQGGK